MPKFGQEWIILENRALAIFKYDGCLPPCQKSEKTNVTFVMKLLNWWIDGQTDGRTGNSDFVGNSDLERESSY